MNTTRIIKTFILAALLILSASIFWKSLTDIYLKGNLSPTPLIWLAASLLAFMVFLLFFSLLVEKKLIAFLIFLFSLASFFIFFPFQLWFLIGLAVLFLIFIANRALIQKERNNRLKISLRAIFKSGLKLTLFFLALFLGLLAYFYPLIKIDEQGVNLPPQVLAWLINALGGPIISKILPTFDPNMTINEMIALNSVINQPDLSSLPPELLKKIQAKDLKSLNIQDLLKDPAVAEALKKSAQKVDPKVLASQRNEMAKNLGLTLTGDEKLSEVLGQVINKQLSGLLGPFMPYLPIISAVLTFIVLTIIFVPFSWLVIWIALFIFLILRIFHFIRIEKVMKEGEDVRL